MTMQTASAGKIAEKPFLQALQATTQTRPPFWFMRQAGRYLPEYRQLRAQKGGFLAMAFDPAAACEITMQPLRRFGMDAAIIFSDILTVPYALGQSLTFEQGEGPKLNPVRSVADLEALTLAEFDTRLAPVYEALRETASALTREGFRKTTLIGFAGAPWTVATYMIEGGGSKDFANVKRRAYEDPAFFEKLMDLLIDATARYLIRQVDAGAEALQIFESWAGALDARQFHTLSITPVREIVKRVRAAHPQIPIIGFPKGAGVHYQAFAEQTGIQGLGLDSAIPAAWAARNLQNRVPVQGNLDPMCLLAGGGALVERTHEILNSLGSGPFIFNLGHGIHKDTPVSHVEQLVKILQGYKG